MVLKRFRSGSAPTPVVAVRLPEDETQGCPRLILQGKNAFVTAAGRNIGEAIALEFARQGANVVCTDVDAERLESVRRKLDEWPVKSLCIRSDVSDASGAELVCRQAWEALGTVDILVNNAGIKIKTKFLGNSNLHGDWLKTYETNLFGPLSLTRHVVERMIAERVMGNVIFVSSIHSDTVLGRAHYASSKAAIEMACKELALELAPHMIRVNTVAPGYVDIDASGKTMSHPPTPLGGHSIHPAYIARAAAFLASDYWSGFMTGSNLKVDAGLSLVNYLDLRPR